MDEEKYMKKIKFYYDDDEKLKQYPTKRPIRLIVLKKIADMFEMNRNYTEKEVNETIRNSISFSDVELIRRELYQVRLLDREKDGSKYWKMAYKIE